MLEWVGGAVYGTLGEVREDLKTFLSLLLKAQGSYYRFIRQ